MLFSFMGKQGTLLLYWQPWIHGKAGILITFTDKVRQKSLLLFTRQNLHRGQSPVWRGDGLLRRQRRGGLPHTTHASAAAPVTSDAAAKGEGQLWITNTQYKIIIPFIKQKILLRDNIASLQRVISTQVSPCSSPVLSPRTVPMCEGQQVHPLTPGLWLLPELQRWKWRELLSRNHHASAHHDHIG